MDRITTQMTSQSVLNEISQAQNRLSQTQNELSTGKRITQPSDDPYGASLTVRLKGELAGLDSYSRNITDATAFAQAGDSALMSMNSLVQRVRELVVQGANGTLTASDRSTLADQVDQLTASVKQVGNTQYAGQYIFSGTATGTAPYPASTDAYQGDSGSILRQIGAGVTIPINVDLSSVLGSGQAAGDNKLLDTLRTISQDLRSGTAAGVAALSSTDLNNLDSNMSALSSLQADVGSVEDRLQLASSRISDLQSSDTKVLSNTDDADMAQVMMSFSTQQNAFTAALKAGASIMQTSLLDFLK